MCNLLPQIPCPLCQLSTCKSGTCKEQTRDLLALPCAPGPLLQSVMWGYIVAKQTETWRIQFQLNSIAFN